MENEFMLDIQPLILNARQNFGDNSIIAIETEQLLQKSEQRGSEHSYCLY